MNTISNCPICDHKDFDSFMEVKDYMITKESFTIVSCRNCGFHFTNPIPEENQIGDYYKSEEYVSHSSTNKGLINKLYGVVRKKTLKQKVRWVKEYAQGRRLLDIGCGTGHFLNAANSSGFNVLGVEPDSEARAFCQRENGLMPLPQESLYTLPENSFDVITMWHVLEHVYQLKKDLLVMSQLLNKEGRFMIAVPNMNAYDARHYEEFWAAYDVPRHLYHFQKSDLVRLMGQFGFRLENVLPMKYDSYYVSMLSEKYKGGSLFKAFLNGWRSNCKAKEFGYSSQVYIFSRK